MHQKHQAVLISSRFLRHYGCGQIDLSYWSEQKLQLIELKSSALGIKSSYKGQISRLTRSAYLLTSLLKIDVHLKYIYKR